MAIVTTNIRQSLSTTSVTMLAVASISSPIGLVIMAQYGERALFYYALVILTFFIPASFIFASLGASFPKASGIYGWVKLAFGEKMGNIAIWSQWLGIITSFPIILSFALSIFLYPFDPHLIKEGHVIVFGSVILLFIAILGSLKSIKAAAWLSYFTAITAMFIPGAVLITIAAAWLLTGHKPLTPMHINSILPHFTHLSTFALIGATIFMFAGMELTANCMHYMKNPKKQYAKAVTYASIIIILLSVLGTLSISILVPAAHTNLISGLMQAFESGARTLHLFWLPGILAVLMLCGFTSMLSVYLISLAKGIQASAKDGLLPQPFAKENRYGIPTYTVVTLSGIAMLITLLFVLLPSVHAAYWLIEAIVIIGSSLKYLMVFPAAVKLHYKKTSIDRIIKIPGGNPGMWCMAGAPFLMVLFATCMTFLPPQQFSIGNHANYDTILAVGTSLFIILPLIIGWYSKKTKGYIACNQ